MNLVTTKRIQEFFLGSIILGNIVVISFAKPLGIESRFFSVPFRIFMVLLSLLILWKKRKEINYQNISCIGLYLFWGFYTIKMFYSFSHHFYEKETIGLLYEYLARIFFIILLPSFALLQLEYNKLNIEKIVLFVFYGLCFLLLLNYFYYIVNKDYIFSTYYIMYGQIGATLFIVSIFLFLFPKKHSPPKFFLLFALLLGIFNVIESTARSPILAVIVVSFYLMIIKKNKKYLFYLLMIVILFFGLVVLHQFSGYEYIKSFNRTYKWIIHGDNSNRTPLFSKAYSIFLSNPIMGNRVLYQDGGYPHNIFLELLMSTGLVGLFLYGIKFSPILFKKNFIIFLDIARENIHYKLFFALFLQYFVLVQVSCNLFSIPEFVYLSSIIIGVVNCSKEKK